MRVDLDSALATLVAELSANSSELSHVDASRVLFVAGAARREARASIRPLMERSEKWLKPEIRIRGLSMRYEICLRPRFFLSTPPADRIKTVIHELLHIARGFDGTLDEDWRHGKISRNDFDATVDSIARRWIEHSPGRVNALMNESGQGEISAWLSRPPSRIPASMKNERLLYTEEDLYRQTVNLGRVDAS